MIKRIDIITFTLYYILFAISGIAQMLAEIDTEDVLKLMLIQIITIKGK